MYIHSETLWAWASSLKDTPGEKVYATHAHFLAQKCAQGPAQKTSSVSNFLEDSFPFCQINSMFFKLLLKNVELIWQKEADIRDSGLEGLLASAFVAWRRLHKAQGGPSLDLKILGFISTPRANEGDYISGL
jgi:hypothetical protein